jgi:hypothetical protein
MFSWRVVNDPVDGGHLVVQFMEGDLQLATVLARCRDEGVADRICRALSDQYERGR